MASIFNDNIQINSSKAIENKQGRFTSGLWRPYNSIQEVYDTLYDINDNPKFVYRGLIVHILIGGINTVYWFRDGILKEHLIPFSSDSITVSNIPEDGGTDAISTGWAFSIDERVTELENASSTDLYTVSIPVSLSSGKSIGKYVSGDTIEYVNKTFEFILNDLAQEALVPTLTLTSPTTISFNQSAIDNILNFTVVINSLGASIATLSLEWRRNNTGSWTVLTTNTGLTTYTHSLTDPLQFSGATNTGGTNTQPFNYRLIVTDTAGGTDTKLLDIIPQSYAAPTISSFSVGSTSRELGNIDTPSITGTITRNSANVTLTNYTIQYSSNNSTWFNVGSTTSISGASAPITGSHNDSALLNNSNIYYRVVVVDTYQTYITGTLIPASATITFSYKSVLFYDVDTTVTLAEINATSLNSALTNSKSRTINGVTATGGAFTYYWYAASAGDLSNIIKNGATPDLGSWTEQADLSGTNSYGATVTYKGYKTNAQNAYTGDNLVFS